MHVLFGLVALVWLAAVVPHAAAQDVTAEVRTWSGESWSLTQPSLEVFYTIMPKTAESERALPETMRSIQSAVDTDITEATAAREALAADPLQGHRQSEVVTLFRQGAEMQIPLARIKSLQFFRQPIEKGPLPPYLAAAQFRYFATAVLVDGSHVDADYVNLGTTVLRGMTPQGRLEIPWQDIENVRFKGAGIPEPTAKEMEVALVPAVPEPVASTPRGPVPVKRKISPLKETPQVSEPSAREKVFARAPIVPEPPVSTPKAPDVSKSAAKEKTLALVPTVPQPPAPTPKVPKPVKRDVVFGFDSLLLSDDAKGLLNELGMWLKANSDAKLVMEGHCDEREQGTSAYNFALGELRFKALRDYLVDAGIDGHRISTASAGDKRPVLGQDASAGKCNRRVHLELVKVKPLRQGKGGSDEGSSAPSK